MSMKPANLIISSIVILIYVLCDYWAFGASMDAFIPVLVLQLLFILIAISPIGEFFLRILYSSKRISTSRDKEYLYPIFNDVYESIIENNPRISKNIQLYIDNSMHVNAYAIGSNTITITRGAVETLTEDELKGVLAHEFGHLNNGDTLLPLILLVGNSIFFMVYLFIKLIEIVIHTVNGIMGGHQRYNVTGKIINGFNNLVFSLAILIIQMILLINQRNNEYLADKFAYEVGYGRNLIEALYTLKSIDMGVKLTLIEKLKSSHPDIDNRIEKLENRGF